VILKNINQWIVQNENEVTDLLNLMRVYSMISVEVWLKELMNGLLDSELGRVRLSTRAYQGTPYVFAYQGTSLSGDTLHIFYRTFSDTKN
jgi:hypothetical protein